MEFDIVDSNSILPPSPATTKAIEVIKNLPNGKLLTKVALAEEIQISPRYINAMLHSFKGYNVVIKYGATRKLVFGNKETIEKLAKEKPELIYRG